MRRLAMLMIPASILLAQHFAFGQGVLVVDQQSSDESHVSEGTVGVPGQEPIQSFTPSLSGVDFIRLWVFLADRGQRLAVNLRADSFDGPILASTDPLTVPTQSYSGALTFLFSERAALTPGTIYYLEPIPIGGGGCILNQSVYDYSRGVFYVNGQPQTLRDLWFQEGILVPEPGVGSLLLVGVALLMLRRCCRAEPGTAGLVRQKA